MNTLWWFGRMVPQPRFNLWSSRQLLEKVKPLIWRKHNYCPTLQIHIYIYTGKRPKAASHFSSNSRKNWGWRNSFVARTTPREEGLFLMWSLSLAHAVPQRARDNLFILRCSPWSSRNHGKPAENYWGQLNTKCASFNICVSQSW